MPPATPPPRRPLPPLPPRLAGPAGHPGPTRARPDPTGLRVVLGFGGLAAASALATAFLSPLTATPPAVSVAAAAGAAPAGPIQRDIQYIQLQPGQTAPPNATVAQAPVATPRVVVVTTRQSGVRP